MHVSCADEHKLVRGMVLGTQESIKAIVVENEASMEELEGKEAERKEVEQKMKAAKKELAVFTREQTLSNKKVAGLEKELSKQQPQLKRKQKLWKKK